MKYDARLLASRTARATLSKRSAADWLTLISAFDSFPLRCQLACVIWFDFFADRPNCRSFFSQYLDLWDPEPTLDPHLFFLALLSLGYVYSDALKRSQIILEEIAYEKLHSFERLPTSTLTIPTVYSVYAPKPPPSE